ncbi:MAG TPA: COX15/CtaA family protein [Chitinophagaceae bacterium]|nr:COX15/CtaA family protein [Chitinophagaceae bacterium]
MKTCAANFAAAMAKQAYSHSSKPIAIWLLVGVAMIIIQILLGGITRLTGSGLSITEWNVVTGTLPPLNDQQWINEFEKYKQTPQYNYLNFDFTLKDFKFIFFWEWFHRFWARLIGVVFIIPVIIFLLQRRFRPEMVRPMLILFLLGALQGTVGWIMVASGLTGDAIYVKPTRLALHFILALGLLCYTFWFALQLLVPSYQRVANPSLRRLTWVILILLTVQLIYGALMAGHKAATAAPTWPDINGSIIPSGMLENDGGLLNLLENKITIHFIHRGLSYLLLAVTIIFTVQAGKLKDAPLFRKTKSIPLFLVLFQLVLGIFSVLTSPRIIPNQWGTFEWLAQLHQLVAMFFLLSFVWNLFMLEKRPGIEKS